MRSLNRLSHIIRMRRLREKPGRRWRGAMLAEQYAEKRSIIISAQLERFQNSKKRGLSRLYRAAVEVLQRDGAECSANSVRHALKDAGIVGIQANTLCWTDDNGKAKKTTFKQFETGLSRHRKALRKK